MRRLLLAAALAACAAPSFAAQPRAPRPPEAERHMPYDAAPPPPDAGRDTVDRSALAMHRMLDALMNLDVGPIADAVEPRSRPRHETLGEMARRDDPAFDARAHRSIDQASGQMDHMIATAHRLEPALRRTIRELKSEVDTALQDGDY